MRYTPPVQSRKPTPAVRPRQATLRALGAQLRRLRLERNLSQERLAELAELNYRYIGKIELAKADPGAGVLIRLARALSVPVGELFETITPSGAATHRLSPADIDALSSALAALTETIDRIVARKPARLPGRARRRSL